MKATRKADRDLAREFKRQKDMVFAAAGLVLREEQGWGPVRFGKVIDECVRIWTACGEDISASMMQMLSKETGIELQTGDGRSWEELAYLNSSLDPGRMTAPKYVYMRHQQIRWIEPQLLACLLLSLHRLHGWGYDRGSRMVREVKAMQAEHGRDPRALRTACMAAYGKDVLIPLG